MSDIIIAWDLDETLGSWGDLGLIWDAIKKVSAVSTNDHNFYELVNLFPNFLRSNIMGVLQHIKKFKKRDNKIKIILFTNNQGPQSWAQLIIKYFNYKLKYELFTEIIPAYKVNGRQVSKCRTSHDKKYTDLINCLNLKPDVRVCFIDDQEHTGMIHHNVTYLHIMRVFLFIRC